MEKIHNNKANISVKVEHFAFAQALCYLCCAKWNVKCESMYENIYKSIQQFWLQFNTYLCKWPARERWKERERGDVECESILPMNPKTC